VRRSQALLGTRPRALRVPIRATSATCPQPARRAGYFLDPYNPCVSGHPPVVVMQATDDRECHDTTVSLGHSRQRLFLPEALVWPRLVVEAGVLRDEAQKMALAKHEDMVEQFAPESADKALGEDACSGSGPRCERLWCRQLRTGSRTEHPAWRRDRRQALRAGRPRLRFAPAAHTSHRTAPG